MRKKRINMPEKVYIFVSHSHYDVEKVRVLRNYLEYLGSDPIMFFLKSKEDSDEIVQLIKDEIDARVWFIYTKSQYAEVSTWCKNECDYAISKGKWFATIDLDKSFKKNGELTNDAKELLLGIVNSFRTLQKIYISYSHKMGRAIPDMIANILNKYGISFFYDRYCLKTGSDWGECIERAIIDSDFFLLLLDKNSLNSKFVFEEIVYAQKNKIKAIPVYFDDGTSNVNLSSIEKLVGQPCFRFNLNTLEESSYRLLEFLFHLRMEEIKEKERMEKVKILEGAFNLMETLIANCYKENDEKGTRTNFAKALDDLESKAKTKIDKAIIKDTRAKLDSLSFDEIGELYELIV